VNRGWVRLFRKILDSRIFQNEGLLKVWIWCLLKTSHKVRWVSMDSGRGQVEVKIFPGQFIYGRFSAAKELKMSPSSVRNRILKLEIMQNLTIKKDRQYSIVSITNWGLYQGDIEKEDSEEDHHRTTKGQPKDTDKNVKNVENLKKDHLSSEFLVVLKERHSFTDREMKNLIENFNLKNFNGKVRDPEAYLAKMAETFVKFGGSPGQGNIVVKPGSNRWQKKRALNEN